MKKTSLAKRLLKEHVHQYYRQLGFAIICMAIAALATASFPYFLKPAFDFIFDNKGKTELVFFCVCILASFVVKGVASYGESVIMLSVGQKIIFDIQERLFRHLLQSDLRFFHNIHSGDLLSRFSNDVNMMRTAVSTTLVGIGKDFLTFIFLTCVMFYRDSTLAGFAFIVFPSAIVPISLIGRRMKKVTENTQNNLGIFSGYLTQIFQGIRIVKAYNAENLEISRIKSKMSGLLKLIIRSAKIKSSLHPISEFIGGIAIVLVLGYGGFQVIHDHKTTGDLISFLGALLLSYEPLKRLTHLSANMQEGLASAKRVFEILDIKPSIRNSNSPLFLESEIKTIDFKDVSFSYDDKRKALGNISFRVKKGETVAFVGKSGSGKSSLINLLPRFYDVSEGSILINEIDIRDLDIDHLRDQIAIVTQETILFDASFYENIAYGKENASREEIIRASRAALAEEFIRDSVNGYDTTIGENGIRISGGQRQRISIARAMLKNSPILLLDEATSSLDTASEKAVQKALDKLMKNRTTLVVAHRLSSIVKADIIYVLDDGKIAESGTHESLLSKKGTYHKLWNVQNTKDISQN
jgi:subfamily B ATP-binding cassette protein MsbA